jgi:hypothetical protein
MSLLPTRAIQIAVPCAVLEILCKWGALFAIFHPVHLRNGEKQFQLLETVCLLSFSSFAHAITLTPTFNPTGRRACRRIMDL